jgi:crotonobetainyl-CoA:carnitine CoA-transferase CaiB-like acyl-CoA transferase
MISAAACSMAAPLNEAAVMVVLDGDTPTPVMRSMLMAGALVGRLGAIVGTHVVGAVPRGFSNHFYRQATDLRIDNPLVFARAHMTRRLVVLTDQRLHSRIPPGIKEAACCIAEVSTGLDRFGAHIPETEFSLLQYSGLLDLIGRNDQGPRALGGHQISHACGMAIFTAIAVSLSATEPQCFVIRVVDVGAWINWKGILARVITGQPITREGGKGPWPVLRCSDGFFAVIYEERDWPRLVDAIDDTRLERFRSTGPQERLRQLETIWQIVEEWTSRRTRKEAFDILQGAGIPAGMVMSGPELLRDKSLVKSGFVRARANGPAIFAAPVRWNGIRFDDMHAAATRAEHQELARAMPLNPGRGPLQGIRVIDCGIITAGAATSALLGDLGAEIIKIESKRYADPFRSWFGDNARFEPQSSAFDCNNRGKKGVGIDLKTSEGRRIFLQLVSQADVVVENFRRGVMDRLGLNYQALKTVNPRIILASISANGSDGENCGISAYGSTLEAMGGLAWSTRAADGTPLISGRNLNFPDQAVALFAAGAVAAAVRKARRDGEGAHLDLSQREVTMFISGDSIADDAAEHVPFGECFETKDGWVAIQSACIRSAASLARRLGLANAEGSDINTWMRGRTADQLIALLATVQIFAARVDRSDQLLDAYLKDAGPFVYTAGGRLVRGSPFQSNAERALKLMDAPPLGRDTRAVLQQLLSVSDDEIDQMARLGAVDIGNVARDQRWD